MTEAVKPRAIVQILEAEGGIPVVTVCSPLVVREVAKAILRTQVSYGFSKDSLLRPREEAHREVLEMLAQEEGAPSATPDLAEEPAWWPTITNPTDGGVQ
jgi:hypothetical protein